MKWLKNLITNNPVTSLLIPTVLSGSTFVGSLLETLKDGQLENHELHQLLTGASGIEVLILGALLLIFKSDK